jgi:hypothetical protein
MQDTQRRAVDVVGQSPHPIVHDRRTLQLQWFFCNLQIHIEDFSSEGQLGSPSFGSLVYIPYQYLSQ